MRQLILGVFLALLPPIKAWAAQGGFAPVWQPTTNGAIYNVNTSSVGVGTALPVTKFDVNGSAQFGADVNKATVTVSGVFQGNGGGLTNISSSSLSGTLNDTQVNLTTGAIVSGEFGDNRVSITTGALASGAWPDGSVSLTTGAISSGKFGDNRLSFSTAALSSGVWQDAQLTNTRTSTITITANAFSVGGSTFVVSGSSVGVDTSRPATVLDVNGPAQFGAGATKSTFTMTGNLALDPAAVLLTGGASASNGSAIIRSTSTTAANPVLAVQSASGAELWQFTQAGNECLGGQLCATTMDIGGNIYTGGTLACPSSGFDLTLKCAPNNVLFNTNSLERMRVANNGNVGIGLTAPGTLLDVNGGATVRGQTTFVSSATFRNTNPSLEVGVLSVANAVIDTPESLEAFIDATNVYTTSAFRWGKGSNAFGAGTELMRLQENGNLGIGLTAPGTLLDVNGGITARGQETVTSSVTILGTGNSVYSLTTSSGINNGGPDLVAGAAQFLFTGTGNYSAVFSSGIIILNNGCLQFGDGSTQCTKAASSASTVTGSGTKAYLTYWDAGQDITSSNQFNQTSTSMTILGSGSLAVNGNITTSTGPALAITTGVIVGLPPTSIGLSSSEAIGAYGVVTSSTTSPKGTGTSCSSSDLVITPGSSDQAGGIVSNACGTMTVTFSKPWRSLSACVVTCSNNTAVSSSFTNSALTITGCTLTNTAYYFCWGQP